MITIPIETTKIYQGYGLNESKPHNDTMSTMEHGEDAFRDGIKNLCLYGFLWSNK